jgi:hypothetical protein
MFCKLKLNEKNTMSFFSFFFLAFLDISLHGAPYGEFKNTKTIIPRKNHQKSPNKVPIYLRGRGYFLFFQCPLSRVQNPEFRLLALALASCFPQNNAEPGPPPKRLGREIHICASSPKQMHVRDTRLFYIPDPFVLLGF